VTVDWAKLKAAAEDVRKRAYAPYSKFLVGAALLAEDGTVITGANVENASYGLCICAERSAIAAAVSQGKKKFSAIAIVAGDDAPASPCGMCRQVLAEFAPQMPVRCYATNGKELATTVAELLPYGFTGAFLDK